MKKLNLIGHRFGRLTIMGFAGINKDKKTTWNCLCDCGKNKVVIGADLRNGTTRSCGCLFAEAYKVCNRTEAHETIKTHLVEYRAWNSAKSRCYKESTPMYYAYGGRGIKMCDRWLNSFLNFFEDMGERPSPKHSLDRINVNGNYEPSNCRWATDEQQRRNRTDNTWLELNGVRKIITDWANELGTSREKIKYHLGMGRTFESTYNYIKEKKIKK